jgi:uncharacterized protein
MTADKKIRRKEFITRCAGAAAGIGMGLGASCGGKAESASGANEGQDSQSAAIQATQNRGPVMRKLGGPGIEVTEVGFGASRTMDPTLMNFAFEQGINFYDTGRAYYNGQNEVVVGKVFKGRREQIVLNGKLKHGSLEQMRLDLEASLTALQTDYIDSLLIHGASEPEHIYGDQTVELFETAREQGKIRTFGFSLHTGSLKLLDLVAEKGFHEVVMVPYNFMGSFTHMLGGGSAEWDADNLEKKIAACAAAGAGIIAMKSCSGGYLKDDSGKGSYPAALKWVLQNPYVKTTATAMGNFQQIEENIGAMGAQGALNSEEVKALETYAAAYGAEYCRMCGSCSGKCPSGVNVAEVNRLQMYAESYGGDMAKEARETYLSMSGNNASSCADCRSCRVDCRWGLDLKDKLSRAHTVLS